jgi:hypothetical protein
LLESSSDARVGLGEDKQDEECDGEDDKEDEEDDAEDSTTTEAGLGMPAIAVSSSVARTHLRSECARDVAVGVALVTGHEAVTISGRSQNVEEEKNKPNLNRERTDSPLGHRILIDALSRRLLRVKVGTGKHAPRRIVSGRPIAEIAGIGKVIQLVKD